MSNKAMGIMSIVKRNGEQKLVYYTSKVLHSVEVRYQKIEKLAYAAV